MLQYLILLDKKKAETNPHIAIFLLQSPILLKKQDTILQHYLNQFDSKMTVEQKLKKMKEFADLKYKPMFRIYKTDAPLIKAILCQNGFEECHNMNDASIIWSSGAYACIILMQNIRSCEGTSF